MHWLDRYATNYHRWRELPPSQEAGNTFVRPLGLIESAFDSDGFYYEGRADINCSTAFRVDSTLSDLEIRQHALLVWACLRLKHPLLRARALDSEVLCTLTSQSPLAADLPSGRCFVVNQPLHADEAYAEAARSVTYVEDFYREVDPRLFLTHLLNTARTIDPASTLSRLFVLPIERLSEEDAVLRVVWVIAHQIADGLTTFAWNADFASHFCKSEKSLREHLSSYCNREYTSKLLPPAQEDLYPLVPGLKARQLWSWAISRILRHKRKAPAESFANPLRSQQPRSYRLPYTFDQIIDYNRRPPLTTLQVGGELSPAAVRNMHKLCREAGISIGSGGFVLVALALMALYEEQRPDLSDESRLACVISFPINARPFLGYKGSPDSLMLTFSDGISLPFLPSTLPIAGRFRLLGRQAHRQLNVYQKRPRSLQGIKQLGSRSASQLIPATYLSSLERSDSILPEALRTNSSPQGAYPAARSTSGAVCGVSSVGDRRKLLEVGAVQEHHGNIKATLISLNATVRARENEFLVGCVGDDNSFSFNVAYDAGFLDEELVERWKQKMELLLEPQTEFGPGISKL